VGSPWRTSDVWPLEAEVRAAYYLSEGALVVGAPDSPSSTEARVAVAAPESTPVTFDPGTDPLVFETEPLSEPLEVTGHPVMDVWIRTDAGDVDVTAQIEDVAPDGSTTSYSMIGRLRASHRATAEPPFDYLGLPWHPHTEEAAEPVPAGEPVRLELELLPMSYVFAEGHRIRLNLTFADPLGRQGEELAVSVLSGGGTPSALILPVIPGI
jgi:putative CocE/NonD family hydrolase